MHVGSLELTFLDFLSFGHVILGWVCRECIYIRRPLLLVWWVAIDQLPLRTLREDEKSQKGKKTLDAELFEDSLLVLGARMNQFSTDPRYK